MFLFHSSFLCFIGNFFDPFMLFKNVCILVNVFLKRSFFLLDCICCRLMAMCWSCIAMERERDHHRQSRTRSTHNNGCIMSSEDILRSHGLTNETASYSSISFFILHGKYNVIFMVNSVCSITLWGLPRGEILQCSFEWTRGNLNFSIHEMPTLLGGHS